MKNQGKKINSEGMPDDEAVSDYLRRHPDFFIRNARDIDGMRVPHPVRGAVSLVEWHMARQRQYIADLQEKNAQLMAQATANHHLFDRLLTLQGNLATASSLQMMLDRLSQWARGLGLLSADIRLFNDAWRLGVPCGFTHLSLSRQAFEMVRIQRFGERQHYLGRLNGQELSLLLPQAKGVGSVAMSLLGKQGRPGGVLIFSSRDAQHYQPDMGTTLLQYLASFLPSLLMRWIEQK